MNTMFNGMFMKVQKGLCMLSPCGIAIKTSSGYRSYDTRSGKLRNCDNLVSSAVETILPERHVFMGNTWFYGKIVSLFGDGSSICGKGGLTKMMKLMMMSSLFDNAGASADGTMAAPGMGNMNALMPLLLLKGGGFDDLFGGLFDEDEKDTEGSDKDTEDDGDLLF